MYEDQHLVEVYFEKTGDLLLDLHTGQMRQYRRWEDTSNGFVWDAKREDTGRTFAVTPLELVG